MFDFVSTAGDTTMFHAETTSTFTCKITLLKKFNLATAASHVLTLQLEDAGYVPIKTVQKSLTITVTDVNDNAPVRISRAIKELL